MFAIGTCNLSASGLHAIIPPCKVTAQAHTTKENTVKLLDGEAQISPDPPLYITSRDWAAEILSEVTEACRNGGYPLHVSFFDLGRALGRATTNSNESEDILISELQRGFARYLLIKRSGPSK
jgi:hypothetical protein